MCNNVNHNTFKDGVGFPTVRRFGVELEGYINESEYGYREIIGTEWEIDSDGSLDGNSDNECSRCDGDGSLYCGRCDGSGRDDCQICNGSGYVSCRDCDGSGNDGDEDCKTCNGTCDVSCDECEEGVVSCGCCDGNGNTTCSNCDGSGHYGSSRYGIEAKSPPLKDTSPIYGAYEWLHEKGWDVDDTAGLHVHVEAEDYLSSDFKKLLVLMLGVEPFIYSITGRNRFYSGYSLPLSNCYDSALAVARSSSDYRRFANTRYMGLNYESYDRHETVEFRYFSPQDEPELVCKYVELVTKIVDFAKHASMEQILVIVEKLIQSQKSFDELSEIIQEIFQLSFVPQSYNSVHSEYHWIDEEDINEVKNSYNISVLTEAI